MFLPEIFLVRFGPDRVPCRKTVKMTFMRGACMKTLVAAVLLALANCGGG